MKFAAIIEYGNHDVIAEYRPKHREYLGKLREQGKLAASGPFTDDSGALIVYETETADEAEDLLQNDPFRQVGVFQTYKIRPWNQVF